MDNVCRLAVIMAQLRDPEAGCPWDLEQTFATIAPHTVEEAYEVVDAIERGDWDDLRDELGDLLLQVIYHSQLAHERDLFTLDDVAKSIGNKLVRRHPHVFGEGPVECDPSHREAWEKQKAAERAAKARGGARSALSGVAMALPSLKRASKLQARASGVGFDWPKTFEILFKIEEELEEVRQEMENDGDQTRLSDEIGDLLFAVVNLARHLDVDAEQALCGANAKFERRFVEIEKRLRDVGRQPEQCSLDELDRLWDDVKRVERQNAGSGQA